MRRLTLSLLLTLLAAAVTSAPVRATDVDGPDCGRPVHDFGDAPEGIPVDGLGGPLGRFPTCIGAQAPGTQTFACPPRSTPPGPTGFVHHAQGGAADYWLGCGGDPLAGAGGIDSETDGKVSASGNVSACSPVVTTDGAGWFGMGQDETESDGDAGAASMLFRCVGFNQVNFTTFVCGPPRTAYLNVLVDLDLDGDWNDNQSCAGGGGYFPCPGACPPDGFAHEWAVVNQPVTLASGCSSHVSPPFAGGAGPEGRAWLRVTLTDEPVDPDFPWAGSANRPGGVFAGGETEDYLVMVLYPDAARRSTWGGLKLLYR